MKLKREPSGKSAPLGKSRSSSASEISVHPTEGDVSRVELILSRLHVVAKDLGRRYSDRPTIKLGDEHDVQDLLHAILKSDFQDVRREEWTPSGYGRSSRVDLLLKKERIVVEVKMPRNAQQAGDIGAQLVVDIARYRKHPDCKVLVCFVYDPESRIVNPKGLKTDLENASTRDLPVRVTIYQG